MSDSLSLFLLYTLGGSSALSRAVIAAFAAVVVIVTLMVLVMAVAVAVVRRLMNMEGEEHTDLPTLPEFPGLSRKNDAYPLPRVLVQNSRAECAPRAARVIGSRYAVCEASSMESSSRLSESGHSSSDTNSEHDTLQTSTASTSKRSLTL